MRVCWGLDAQGKDWGVVFSVTPKTTGAGVWWGQDGRYVLRVTHRTGKVEDSVRVERMEGGKRRQVVTHSSPFAFGALLLSFFNYPFHKYLSPPLLVTCDHPLSLLLDRRWGGNGEFCAPGHPSFRTSAVPKAQLFLHISPWGQEGGHFLPFLFDFLQDNPLSWKAVV